MTLSTLAVALLTSQVPAGNPSEPLETRVENLLKQMTLEEKIAVLHGDSKFTTAAIPRLGIPRRWMSDGPHGVREDVGPDTWEPAGRTDDFSTYMPINLCLASSWDEELGRAYGTVIGQEAKARGKHIMLGPGVNIMRTPLNGRNFEYLGEDPYLAGRMAVGYIQGVQAEDVASCVKHFAGNNQETQRGSIDVQMDDRTLHEIYLPAFRAAVQEGKVWTLMGAYNKFRGQYCCHNGLLLNQILKKDWGFQGLVMTDWGGAHSTSEAALNGLDLEMGTNTAYDKYYLSGPFKAGLQDGTYPMSLLDDKVRRNLRVMLATKAIDGRGAGSLNTAAHQAAARRVAEEGMVLLKNQGNLLPFDPTQVKTVAVIGANAVRKFARGGGSAGIKAFYEVTPLEGILNRVGTTANVSFSPGFVVPERRRPGRADAAGVRTETTVAAAPPDPQALIDQAIRAAKEADAVIYVGGLFHGRGGDDEGSDRTDLRLPFGQDALIAKLAEANPRLVVTLISGGPIEMDPWLDKVPAVLQAWYPGMEGGNAIARVLFGDVNPSGKLTFTFPKKLADSPAHAMGDFPGKDGIEVYREGIFVGYRWFDTKKVEPLFPFGHGLSYTSFKYDGLQVASTKTGATVHFEIANTGAREGAEIAQVYIQPVKPRVERPLQELKAFRKVVVKSGEKVSVDLTLPARAFAYYDAKKARWVADKGEYRIAVGASSRDIRQTGTVKITQATELSEAPE